MAVLPPLRSLSSPTRLAWAAYAPSGPTSAWIGLNHSSLLAIRFQPPSVRTLEPCATGCDIETKWPVGSQISAVSRDTCGGSVPLASIADIWRGPVEPMGERAWRYRSAATCCECGQ